MSPLENPAVVLLSGGLDSAVTACVARSRGYGLYCLTVDYGQRHRVEIDRARGLAQFLRVQAHRVIALDLTAFGGSALTAGLPVPKGRDESARAAGGIPITYVPARNTIFLALALAWAEVLSAHHIFIGVNCVDYSGYPDCRPEFIRAFEAMAALATKMTVAGTQVHIETPLIAMSKADIIRRGALLELDFSLTSSCYDPSAKGEACGACDSCRIRKEGFAAAGIKDPIAYRDEK